MTNGFQLLPSPVPAWLAFAALMAAGGAAVGLAGCNYFVRAEGREAARAVTPAPAPGQVPSTPKP